MNRFLSLLQNSSSPLLADGAMGTLLHARGVPIDHCFDELNLSNPNVIMGVHNEYLEAGSQILLTNTFGANRFKLSQHGLQNKVDVINREGVKIARKAAGDSSLVAGDIGPLGVRIAPFGRIQPEQAYAAFVEQARSLMDAGVDLIVIETMSDLYEIQSAVQAVHEAAPGVPIIASVTFTRDDRTILGDSPEKVAHTLEKTSADVIGVNCSGGPAQLLRLLKAMRTATPDAKIWVKPNAGWPEQMGGRIMYPADPNYFGDYALAFCEAGASIIGGCCGTTPQHIAAMRRSIDANPFGCRVQVLPASEVIETGDASEWGTRSELAQKLEDGKFVISAEMDPPRGLSTHKLIAGASLLQEAGADVINVADSPMARMRMSAWAVCEIIQRQVGVETTLHFPTRGRNLLRVQGDLLAAHAMGIRNIFVVMGDPTSVGDYPEAMDNFDLVPSGLIKLIKQGFNTGVDHSGASIGQPTSFFVGGALNLNASDVEHELRNAHRKILAGVDFFLTQPIYRSEVGPLFFDRYAAKYGELNKPVLVGVLPLVSARHVNFLHNEIPGISIPEDMRTRMENAGDDGAKIGVGLAIDLIGEIKSWAQGVYLMPQFSRYDLIAEILDKVAEPRNN